MARHLETDTLSNQDISSALAIGAYTATGDKMVVVQWFCDQCAGNGDYTFYITQQIAGAGSEYRYIPITEAAAAAGVTAIAGQSIQIAVRNADVLTLYLDGLAGDTVTPDTTVRWFEIDTLAGATADKVEDIFDGTGGVTMTLAQLRVDASDANGGIYVTNDSGPGAQYSGTTRGIYATASAGPGMEASGTTYGVYNHASAGIGIYNLGATGAGQKNEGTLGLNNIGSTFEGTKNTGASYGVFNTGSLIGTYSTASAGPGMQNTGTTYGLYNGATDEEGGIGTVNEGSLYGTFNSGFSSVGAGMLNAGDLYGLVNLATVAGSQGQVNQGVARGLHNIASAGPGMENGGTTQGVYNVGSAGPGMENSGTTYGTYNTASDGTGLYNAGSEVGQYNLGTEIGLWNKGATYGIENAATNGIGQYNHGTTQGVYNMGSAGPGQQNSGTTYGQQNVGTTGDVDGYDTAILDAIWDESLAGHTTAGTSGYHLGLVASGSITITSPVAADDTATIYAGDDYANADSRALEWTSSDWPDLTDATITMYVRAPDGTTDSFDGSAPVAGAGSQTVRVELTDEESDDLLDYPSPTEVRIKAVLSSDNVVTLVDTTFTIVGDIA